jgi:hypothetical protein
LAQHFKITIAVFQDDNQGGKLTRMPDSGSEFNKPPIYVRWKRGRNENGDYTPLLNHYDLIVSGAPTN